AGGLQQSEGRLPARSVRTNPRWAAQSRRARRPARRDRRRTADGSERGRPVDRRDVPDVPPAPAGPAAGRGPRDRERRSGVGSAAEAPRSEADHEARRSVAAVPVSRVLVSVADAAERAAEIEQWDEENVVGPRGLQRPHATMTKRSSP